jgi:DNA ligase-1
MYFNKAASIFQLIEAIAATPSKLEKEALMKKAELLPLFKRVVIAAYDPLVTYGLSQAPKKRVGLAPGGNTLDEDAPWGVLAKLANRSLTGNAAREEVQRWVDVLDDASSELFRRIIAKDLRAGFTDGTVNRVFPGTIIEFPYMRCSLQPKSNMAKWDWSLGMISQEKADGMFANVNRAGEAVSIHSRQGTAFPAGCMPELEAVLAAHLAPETQTHGELVVYREQDMGEAGINWVIAPREIGNGILTRLAQGGALRADERVGYMAWDQIPLSAVRPKGKVETPYKDRLVTLIRQVKGVGSNALCVIPTQVVRDMPAALAHYRQNLAAGKEGTVLKHPLAIWKDGTSKDQVKFKLEIDVDLLATKVVPGRPGTKNEGRPGSVTCQSACGALVVDVAIKNEAMRDAVEKDPDSILAKIFAVRGNSVLSPSESNDLHSIFLPRFVEAQPRIDKTVADDLQRIKDQFNAAVAA